MSPRVEEWVFDGTSLLRRGRTSVGVSGFLVGMTQPTLTAGIGKAGPRVTEAQMANYAGSITTWQTGDPPIDRLIITGYVQRGNTNGMTIQDSKILVGADPSPGSVGNWPAVRCWGTGTNTLIQFCEIAPSNPGARVYGIHGWDFHAYRCHIHDCVDSFVTSGQNTLIEGCYIEKARWYAVDPNQTDGTHNDEDQLQGGSNHIKRGNFYDAGVHTVASRTSDPNGYGANFGILGTQDTGLQLGAVIDANWFTGTPYSHIQLGDSGDGAWPSLAITGNRFLMLSRNASIRMSDLTKATATISGNTGPNGLALAGAQIEGAVGQR